MPSFLCSSCLNSTVKELLKLVYVGQANCKKKLGGTLFWPITVQQWLAAKHNDYNDFNVVHEHFVASSMKELFAYVDVYERSSFILLEKLIFITS